MFSDLKANDYLVSRLLEIGCYFMRFFIFIFLLYIQYFELILDLQRSCKSSTVTHFPHC